MSYTFDPLKTRHEIVEWIRDWFEENGKTSNAIIGISGGKDSTVAAALCAEALGKDRVIGILMPNGEQSDINDSREVVKCLGIRNYTLNIKDIVDNFFELLVDSGINPSAQTTCNLPPRVRMSMLYAVSQSNNGRVVNTCNLSENMCGYSTLYGDHAGDFSLFDQLTVSEIIKIGLTYEDIPERLIIKTPSDGLCGKTDEEALGFTYANLDNFIRTGECDNSELKKTICEKYSKTCFKLDLIHFPHYEPGLPNFIPWSVAASRFGKI